MTPLQQIAANNPKLTAHLQQAAKERNELIYRERLATDARKEFEDSFRSLWDNKGLSDEEAMSRIATARQTLRNKLAEISRLPDVYSMFPLD